MSIHGPGTTARRRLRRDPTVVQQPSPPAWSIRLPVVAAFAGVRARRVVYGGTLLYALLFVGVAALHVEAFQAAHADLGSMVQAVWSTAHGRFLEITTLSGKEVSRLVFHVDPFLVLLVPLWWVWPSPVMIVAVQAAAVSAGALPVYWLARKHLRSERAAAHFAFAYLLYPATQFAAFTISSGFHAVSIAVPLLLYAVWWLDEQRLVPFAVVALLAVATKEEVGFAVACLGIWYAVRRGKRLVGGTILALGLGISLVDFLVIIPHFSPTGVDPFAGRYAQVGGTPTGILHKAVTDPVALVQAVATWHKLLYVVLLLAPFLGLWLLEPLLLLGAVPDLAINLLSSKADQTSIGFHWTATIVPFTVAASILGAARLKRDPARVSLYVLAAVGSLAIVSPIYFAFSGGVLSQSLGSNRLHAVKAHALALVPDGVPVSASNQLATYLSARRRIYVFPTIRDARWLVVDRNDDTYGDAAGYRRVDNELSSLTGWKMVYESHGIDVLRRTSSNP